MSYIISVDDAHKLVNDVNVKFIDASFYMPNLGKDIYEIYKKAHIPNARFIDINEIADKDNPLPHMMPDLNLFNHTISELGIENSDTIIVYDQTGIAMAACRAWWMFKSFGHDKILVLNGGLPEWKKSGYELESGQSKGFLKTGYKASFKKNYIADKEQVLNEIGKSIIFDARSKERFTGKVKEPRKGLVSGHIPKSINIPYTDLLNDNKLKTTDELKKIFSKKIESEKNIICSCGSGVTACVIALAIKESGYDNHISIYDGSWSEWGQESLKLPISVG